jgi:hypothetical protein
VTKSARGAVLACTEVALAVVRWPFPGLDQPWLPIQRRPGLCRLTLLLVLYPLRAVRVVVLRDLEGPAKAPQVGLQVWGGSGTCVLHPTWLVLAPNCAMCSSCREPTCCCRLSWRPVSLRLARLLSTRRSRVTAGPVLSHYYQVSALHESDECGSKMRCHTMVRSNRRCRGQQYHMPAIRL